MLGSVSLLHLPLEIRLQIYEAHFSSTIVRACTTLELLPASTSSSNSLALACKCVREECLPYFYEHALFWIDSIAALIHLVNHQTAAQLQSIRHFAIRNSLVPLPLTRTLRNESGLATTIPTTLQIVHQAFYQQICSSLQTLVIFNTTNAGTRRRILEQQAGRTFTDDEFENHCFDGMCLKAQLLLPVLKEQGVVVGPNRLSSDEDHIPFRIMLRYSGTDDKHRVGIYRPKKGSQQVPARIEPEDPGTQIAFTFV